MRIQKNMIVIGVGAVVAVFLCLAVFLLVRGVNKFRDTERELDSAMKRLKNFYLKDPFPSDDNVNRARQNVAVLNEWSDKLLSALTENKLEIQDRTPTFLMDLLRDKKREFKVRALESGTVIPEEFAFGFESYSQTGDNPDPGNVKKLSYQLIVVENLCNMLFEQNVAEIIDVEREEFEKGEVVPKNNKKTPKKKVPKSQQAVEAEEDPVIVMQRSLYDKLHFTLRFKTCEVGLWNLMNRIAGHEIFMAVTTLEAHNPKKNLHPIVPTVSETGAVLDEDGRPIDKFKGVPPRWERMVSGVECEMPMIVEMGIDVYTFKGAKGDL